MRKCKYKNYNNRKTNDCTIRITDYNVAYVINEVAKDRNMSKADLIKELMYDSYASYFHKIPESIDSIIANINDKLRTGWINEADENYMEYIIDRLEKLKGENNANN